MTGQEYAEEIVRLWNLGEKELAKKLFQKSQWVLPVRIKMFLKKKMSLCFDQKGIYYYKKTIQNDGCY